MRAALILLVACSTAAPRVIPSPVADPGVTISTADLVRASHARWLGDPATSAKIVARAGDIEGLAELGRAELALGHVAAADSAFQRAVERAEQRTQRRGAWQWPTRSMARIAQLAFTPDGRWLATADTEGRVDVYDFASMRIVRSFATSGLTRVFEISPNGRWLATAKETTQVWALDTGAMVAELPYQGSIAFTPTNLLLATRPEGGFVEVDVTTRKELRGVAGAKFSRIVASRDKIYAVEGMTVRVFDTSYAALDDIALGKPINDLRAAGDDIVAVTDDALVIRGTEHKGRYYAVATNGSTVAATTNNGIIEIYEDGTLARRLAATRNHESLTFHPLGGVLAAGGWDGANLWNAATARHLLYFAPPPSGALSLAFDARGDKLAVGSGSGHATIWTLATGAASTITVRPGTIVDHVAFSPDGELATVAADINAQGRTPSTLTVFDARGVKRWDRELDRIFFLGYRPGTSTLSSTQIVAKGNEGSTMATRLWKADGTIEKTIELDTSRGFHWNADGSAFFGTTNNELVSVKLDGTQTRIDLPHYQSVLNPSGTLLAAALDDGRIGIWDLATKSPIRVLFDDNGQFTDFAWTPDGKTLATASYDIVTLWDPTTGERLAALDGPAPISSLAIHPAGKLIAAGHDDGRVTLWSMSGALIATLHSPGELAAFITTPDGAVDGTLSDDVLAWSVGPYVLPARGAFARQRTPGFLASRIASLARTTSPPRTHPIPPPPPPTCYPEGEYNQRSLRSASVDGNRVRLCLDHSYFVRNRVSLRPPTMCFDLDLATGKHTPYAPGPREALGVGELATTTAEVEGGLAHVCEHGRCRDIKIREVENTDNVSLHLDDNAKLLAAVYHLPAVSRDAVLVYDIASGKRISQFITQGDSPQYSFLDETLMVTSTPCAGPCSSSVLFDARKGKEIGGVGVNTSAVSPTKLANHIWAFNDWDSTNVVLQSVKTGRIASSFAMPKRACTNEPDSEYVSCDGITLLTAGSNIVVLPSVRPGDVMVVNQKGTLVAEHALPICR